MQRKRLVIVIAILIMMTGVMTGCALTGEESQELDDATQQVLDGVADGSLSINDAKLLLGQIDELRGANYSWWEIGGAIVAGVLGLRGVPSKGPLRWGINAIGSLLKK